MLSRRKFLEVLAGGASAVGPLACSSSTAQARPERASTIDVPAPRSADTTASLAPSKPIAIGVLASLTGSLAEFGAMSKLGVELALDELKASPPRGLTFSAKFADDESRAQTAVNDLLELVDRDHVVALLGEVASGISKPCGVAAVNKKIPMLSPCSTAPDVTATGAYVFRACFIDDVQGALAAQYIAKTLGKRSVGLVVTENDLYSTSIAESFKKTLAGLGAKVVVEKRLPERETNFMPAIRDLKTAKVEMVFAPTYSAQMIPLAKQALAEGLGPEIFFGADGWSSEQALYRELEGARFIDHWAPGVPYPKSKSFVAAFTARHSREPDAIAALSYDAMLLLAAAAARAADVTPDGIRDALAATKDFEGASGRIAMGQDRNPTKPGVVLAIRGGTTAFEAVVGP